MLVSLALAWIQTATFKPNAVLGTPYLLGGKRYVSGTKEVVDTGTELWTTVNAVRSTLFFTTKFEDYKTGPGLKLFLIDITIKNPSKVVYNVGPNGPFTVRVHDPKGKAEDYHVHGAVRKDLETLRASLKRGESVDLTLVLQAPAKVDTCRVGLFFNTDRNNTRWYDLTEKVQKSTSAYCVGGFVYGEAASVGVGKQADFDWLLVKALGVRQRADNEYVVELELTNPGFKPGRWGWQYASAKLASDQGETTFYPQLYDKEGKMWAGDVPVGGASVVEYRFFPGKEVKPKSITLTSVTSKRTLTLAL